MDTALPYVIYACFFVIVFIYLTLRNSRPVRGYITSSWREYAVLGLITVLFVALSRELLFTDEYLPVHDNLKYQFPFFHFFIDSLIQTGDIPYWLPYVGSGQPHFLYLNNSFLLHLPHLLVFLSYPLLPGNANTLILYWWAVLLGNLLFSLGCYVMFRVMFSSVRASLFGYSACLFSGITAGTLHQEQLMASTFYVPWIMAFTILFARTGRLAWGLLAALFMGLSLLCHYPHLVIYFWAIMLLSYAVFRREEFLGIIRSRWKTLVLMGTVVLVFFSFDAVMLFSYKPLITSPLRNAAEGGIGFDYGRLREEPFLRLNSLNLHTLLHYIFPKAFLTLNTYYSGFSSVNNAVIGQWWYDNRIFYIGLVPLFFIIYGYLQRVTTMLKVLSLALLLLLFFALGAHTFGYFLIYSFIPFADLQRVPAHLANYINILLITLSVSGVRAFINKAGQSSGGEG